MKSTIAGLIIWIAVFFGSFPLAAADETLRERSITVDLQQVQGPLNPMFKFCVGAGRANEGLRADWQRQLAYVHKECGFTYIRMHGLFTDDMGVYREENGQPQYNWQYVDELYDFLHRIGMKPFVELSFMPSALASGYKTFFWWRAIVTPPRDMTKWADLVRAFVLHERERYGDAEVRTWYFEVWNEPNLKDGFWTGTQQQYFDLYAATARAIKSVSPDYKVGGPATAGCDWIPEFIHFCDTNHAPVDFISGHTYAVDIFVDEKGAGNMVLSQNPNSIFGDVKHVRQQIAESAMPNLGAHFTEWSTSCSPFDPVHDSYHSAAFILDKLKKCGDAPLSMSYWTFTDIFEEAGPRWEAFHGGFGLLNYQDINKPSFYAYQFLNRMGPTELKNSDPSSWICADKSGGVQALVWDYTNTHPGKNVPDLVYYKQDLPSRPKNKVTLNLSHLPGGKYTMEIYQVGYRVNDACATYRDLGAPAQLTQAQVAEIKSKNSGAPLSRATVTVGKNGMFKQEFDLRENDVVLVTLQPVHK